MVTTILSRLLTAIPVLFIVITFTFFLVKLAPGNPFDQDQGITPEVRAALNAYYHLDEPLVKQFVRYIGQLLQGDLGPSFRYPGRQVNEIIASGLPVTFELGLYALIGAVLIGLIMGVTAALHPNTWIDRSTMTTAMIGICTPSFLLGPLLVLFFGIFLGWLPVSGWGAVPGDKILPSLTLGATYAAYIARLSRSGTLDTLSRPFVRTAIAKGLHPLRIILIHVLRGSLQPVVAFLGPATAGLLAGSFVVETVFNIPGMGRFYVQAAFNRDYTLIMGTTILFASLIILLNLISDLIQILMDPRLRDGKTSQLST